jgi:hypothetical protein
MRIRLLERNLVDRRRTLLLDEEVGRTGTARSGPWTLGEGSDLVLTLEPGDAPDFEARVYVGDVLAASTRERDRPEFLIIRVPATADDVADSFAVYGRLLRDWVGQTYLTVRVHERDGWRTVLEVAPVYVMAGKLEQEAFEALCQEIANHSAAALLDTYGKTFFGLEPERRPGETAPVAALQRVRQALDQMAVALREIAHQPAYRLKARRLREPALADQAVSDLTLEEACVDPTLLIALGGKIGFREHVRETAAPSFNLPENRLLSGFLTFLRLQINDLRGRLQEEVDLREERRAYRHRRAKDGGKTWWEAEDLPRIEEARRLLDGLAAMEREVLQLGRYPFLPPAPPLGEVPPSTPLLRAHRAYASAYKVIVSHFRAFRVRLDDEHLLTRAKSLPVLYEWWCVLEVLRILQSCLRPRVDLSASAASPFRRLGAERDRFVVEFAPDQAVDFTDERGRLVRLRYLPSYRAAEDGPGPAYGWLGAGGERVPDMTVEVFAAGAAPGSSPDLLIVLDAKYTSDPHDKKLEEVKLKYDRIGVFRTGAVLSRQVWALVPTLPPRRSVFGPEWASFCTVDNHAFWSEHFDVASTVAGTVQAKPRMPPGRSPLESLLRLLLKRCGVTPRT